MKTVLFGLLWLLVFAIPWEEAFVVASVGSVSRAVGYTILVVAGGYLLTTGRVRRLQPIHIAQAAFLAWCSLTLFWTADMALSESRVLTYVRVIGLGWLVWQFAPEKADQLRLLVAYVLGSLVSVASLFAQVSGAGTPTLSEYEMEVRYRGAGMNENDLAMILALSVAFAYFLATSEDTTAWKRRGLFWLYIPLAVMGALFTGSRGGFLLLLVVGASALLSSIGNVKTWLLTALALSAVVVGSERIVPGSVLARALSTGEELQYGSWSGRKFIFQAGLAVFAENPLLGVGCGTFVNTAGVTEGYQSAHNTFLAILVEDGIVGLALFLAVTALAVLNAAKLRGRSRTTWLTILLAWAVAGMSGAWDYAKTTWLIFALIACQSAVQSDLSAARAGGRTRAGPWERWPQRLANRRAPRTP